jgi:hypothetical protein
MKRRIAIYGGTELSLNEAEFVSSLTYTLLTRINAIIVTGGFLYSNDAPGAISTDVCVLNGAKKFATEKGIDLQGCFETWLPDREAENDPQKKNVVRFREGTVIELNGQSAQTRRFSIVRGMDVIITVKGKKHTAMMLDFALAINKPAFPLAFTGGDSSRFWRLNANKVTEWFDMNEDSIEWMKAKNFEAWSPEETKEVINQIVPAVNRGLENEASNQEYYKGIRTKLQLGDSRREKNFVEEVMPGQNKSATNSSNRQLSMFLSYSHKDKALKEELDTQLIALKRSYNISLWQDKDIEGGSEWDATIKEELKNADIILLLISPDFIASDYINDVELKYAMQKHEEGKAKVIPIYLKKAYTTNQPVDKLQGYISKDKPITSFPEAERSDAFYEVVARLGHDIETWLAK